MAQAQPGGDPMTAVRFMLPPGAAHALLEEAVFARACDAGFADPRLEFEDSNRSKETRIACGIPMARFVLAELRRIKSQRQDELGISFHLTVAAIVVRRAIEARELRT